MMQPVKPLVCLVLLSTAGALPAAVHAATCAGTNINNTLHWGPSEVVKGTKVSIVKFTSVIVSDDSSAAIHLASGECVGAVQILPDGTRSANGFCTRKNKEGDVLNEKWETGGGGKGTSTLLGGTGKFAGLTGSWQWQHMPLYGPTAAVRWSGDCR